MKRLRPSPHWTTGALKEDRYGFEDLIEILEGAECGRRFGYTFLWSSCQRADIIET